MMKYNAVVIGSSAGGLHALQMIFSSISVEFPLPIAIVQHTGRDSSALAELIATITELYVIEAEDKESFRPGTIHVAPADYHLMIQNDRTLSLSMSEKEHYSRPSIDVLFESAADVFGSQLIGIILTGANKDGAEGLKRIKEKGGLTIVQDPQTAESKVMPQSAIEKADPQCILPLEEIGPLLNELAGAPASDNKRIKLKSGTTRNLR